MKCNIKLMEEVIVIGGGMAGVEASYRLANMGIRVLLYEMRPQRPPPAHRTDKLAELVCSTPLGSMEITSGAGLLKAEMEMRPLCASYTRKASYLHPPTNRGRFLRPL